VIDRADLMHRAIARGDIDHGRLFESMGNLHRDARCGRLQSFVHRSVLACLTIAVGCTDPSPSQNRIGIRRVPVRTLYFESSRYRGTTIDVSGVLDHIDASGSIPVVTFNLFTPESGTVRATFKRAEAAIVSKLQRGQAVMLRCRVDDSKTRDVLLSGCQWMR
jgi:hypothetical protein